jgi:hypothetical protein
MSEVAVPNTPAPGASKSAVARLLGVFFSPGETFEDVARKPDFVLPFVVSVITAWILFDTMFWKLGMETLTRMQLERSSFAARLTDEQIQQAISQSAGHLTRQLIITDAVIPIVGILALLIFAGLGMLIVNAILGGEAKFKTLFCVATYANFVSVLGNLVALPIILFGGTDNLDPQNPIPLNLAFFLNFREVSKPLFALAGSVDILPLWIIILMGIGMSKASGGKAKATTITLCFAGAWAVWILGKVGLTMLF